MTRFAFQPIYESPLLIVALVVVFLVAIVALGPPADKLTAARWRWLVGLRIAAALTLLAGVLRPSLVFTDNRPAPATLAVLLDGSRSMTLPAGDGQDRATVQQQVWQSLAPALTDARDETLDVVVLGYAGQPQPLPLEEVDAWTQQVPEGDETNLAAALRGAIGAAAGRPLAGVILLGDGTQTAEVSGPGAQQTARTLAALEVPLWTVPIGPPGDGGISRDVAIEEVPASFRVFSGNTFEVSATVRTRSLVGTELPVEVRLIEAAEDAAPQAAEILTRRTVVPRIASDSQQLVFPLVAPPPGRYRLEVTAEEQAGETITTNNRQVAFLDVREGGGRILYVEGELRQEQTFLRRALRRFPDLELVFRWIGRDTAGGWPIELTRAFDPGAFDVFVLGDLDARALGQAQLRQLRERIDEGASLLMLGGLQTLSVGGYAESPLAEVLPIEMEPAWRRSLAEPPPEAAMLTGPIPIQVPRRHPITTLGDPATSQATWERLKPLLGANRLADLKVAPGVQVLLESPDQDPLLVIGEYGGGRVAVMAGDSTWQWWRQGASDAHRRFWRQLMLWLLSREGLSDEALEVELDSRRFAREQAPAFRVRWSGGDSDSAANNLAAEVIGPEGTKTPLTVTRQPSAAGELVVGGTLPSLPPGLYELRGYATQEGPDPPRPDRRAFQVVDNDRERARPLADPAMLGQLASLTATAGGRVYTPDQVDGLLETIRQNRQDAVTPVIERKRLGNDPLSGWLLLATFVALLASEWFLRRRWGLA